MEWICPVIDSIYGQDVHESEFEVIVVDNGNDKEFQIYMQECVKRHTNLIYKRVQCSIFMNEIYAYKLASGDFIKFINHRTLLLEGTLRGWIDFMNENAQKKPVIYFSNGVLDKENKKFFFSTFNEFVHNLSYWSSWSTGMAIWKEDLETIPENEEINELFPHTTILLRKYDNKETYIIDNNIYLQELPHNTIKKGNYDLFYAFAVEYPSILLKLYQKKEIDIDTFLSVKQENLDFIISQYNTFVSQKKVCSYDLTSYKDSIEVFYSQDMVTKRIQSNKEKYLDELNRRIERFKSTSEGIVLYGAGVIGKSAAARKSDQNILCFIDNDPAKWNNLCMGIPVVSMEKFVEMKLQAKVYVCVSAKNVFEIEHQLKELAMKYEIFQ